MSRCKTQREKGVRLQPHITALRNQFETSVGSFSLASTAFPLNFFYATGHSRGDWSAAWALVDSVEGPLLALAALLGTS